MAYRSFEPQVDLRRPTDVTGMVLLNHLGSSVHQDTGRDAQYLADTFSMPVIAADRPGTGWMLPDRSLADDLRRDYVTATFKLAGQLAAEADRQGLKRLIALGRSAGGLGALALTNTEQLPITHLYAAEPPGWYNLSYREGSRLYRDHMDKERLFIRDADRFPDLVLPDKTDTKGLTRVRRQLSMLPLLLIDRYHNQGACLTNTASRCAWYIATRFTDIDTTIVFATNSLVAPPDLDVIQENEVFNRVRPKDSAPFVIRRTEEHTTHGSFDKRTFFAREVRPIVQRALGKA